MTKGRKPDHADLLCMVQQMRTGTWKDLRYIIVCHLMMDHKLHLKKRKKGLQGHL